MSRIMKVASLSFAGFCAVSLVADKVITSPEASQIAGYCGAFVGALVGRGRSRRGGSTVPAPSENVSEEQPSEQQASTQGAIEP
jgi:hypothetical protein